MKEPITLPVPALNMAMLLFKAKSLRLKTPALAAAWIIESSVSWNSHWKIRITWHHGTWWLLADHDNIPPSAISPCIAHRAGPQGPGEAGSTGGQITYIRAIHISTL
jgi:hypothetical protein